MKQTYTFEDFETELPVEGENLCDSYYVSLKVVADVSYVPGVIPSSRSPGKPSCATVEILSYEIVAVEGCEKEQVVALNARLHDNPPPSLSELYQMIWDEFIMMQEDGGGFLE